MEADYLKSGDQILVEVYDADGKEVYTYDATGIHNLEQAIGMAFEASGLTCNPQDCVFKVVNRSTGVSHRYRLNAHDNVKLIEEQY